jgi:hypothetical protein
MIIFMKRWAVLLLVTAVAFSVFGYSSAIADNNYSVEKTEVPVDLRALTSGDSVTCQCDGYYSVGDRVVASVDNPSGAYRIQADDMGTVICGASSGSPVLLISWDDWQHGHNGNGHCGCPVTSLPDSSGWYVDCDEVEKAEQDPCDLNSDGKFNRTDVREFIRSCITK